MSDVILGLSMAIVWGSCIYWSVDITMFLGRIPRAEQKLGSTKNLYILFGMFLVFLGFLFVFGVFDAEDVWKATDTWFKDISSM